MHQSIATIDSPEFVNLQPLELNPLMSSCEIKVLYVGENRNHSFITKEVAKEMSKTLRGAPIVGYYKTDKEDFADHGERITFDDEGIHFDCMTKPYGFVSPDAKVWFQKFEDYDDFGNSVVREYLMTTGYLWTGQFEECGLAINEGRPQSMELDEKTLDGNWSKNNKTGIDFFIINDAIFSKLCILGDDVEPCFEGANVTTPVVSTSFTLDKEFKTTLFNMMQDLKNYTIKGGAQMDNLENPTVESEVVETTFTENVEETVENQNFTEENPSIEQPETSFKKNEDSEDETSTEEEPKEETSEDSTESTDDEEDKKKVAKSTCGEDDEKKKYSLEQDYEELNAKFSTLQNQYEDLETRYNELLLFKQTVDNAKKDELINSFYMLSDEDKQDVIAHKAEYSYDDIEAKLSVICVRKKVNFDLEDTSKNNNTIGENPTVIFNLDNTENAVPAWISALKNARMNNI